MAYPVVPVTFSQTPITFGSNWITWSGGVPLQTPQAKMIVGADGILSS